MRWPWLVLVALAVAGCAGRSRAVGDDVVAEDAAVVETTVLPVLAGLPDEGVAVETARGVTFYGLDGAVVAELAHARFESGGLDDAGPDEVGESFRVRTTNGIVPIGVRQLDWVDPQGPSPVAGCNLRRHGASFAVVSCPEDVPSFGSVDDQSLDVVQGSTRRALASRQDDLVGWWQGVTISPDEQFISAEWHTECDSARGFVIRVEDGERWELPGPAMGWTRASEVLYIADSGTCDDLARGVYAMRPGSAPRLVAPLPKPDPTHDTYAVEIWRRT